MRSAQAILLMIFSTLVFAWLNIGGLVDGPPPDIWNLLLSLMFLLIWYSWGFIQGKKQNRSYLLYASTFWGLGIIATILCVIFSGLSILTSLWLLSFPFIAPMNGFGFLTRDLTENFRYLNLIYKPVLPLLTTLIGYYMGKKKSNMDRQDEKFNL